MIDLIYFSNMQADINTYHSQQTPTDVAICEKLYHIIETNLPDAIVKVWHGHPVWFIDANPIVGYSKQKAGIKLMFWSGVSFDEPELSAGSGKFKDASIFYTLIEDINDTQLKTWLNKAERIQWDYKNVVKRKGVLLPLKGINE